MPVKDGHLWLVGGALYNATINTFYNDVWKFNGTTWTEVLADGHTQFPKSRYHSVLVDRAGTLWRFNGTTWDGTTLRSDTNAMQYSSDGITWTTAPESLVPWTFTHAQAAIASTDGIYLTDGYHSTNMNVIEELVGPMASAWNDLGEAARAQTAQRRIGSGPIG